MDNPFEGVEFEVLGVGDTVCIDNENHSKNGHLGTVTSVEGSTVWVEFGNNELFPFH